MQTAIATTYALPTTNRTDAPTSTRTKSHALVNILARRWDMIGVVAVMGASVVYAALQLMTLAR